MDFLEVKNLIPKITDKQIEEMLEVLTPIHIEDMENGPVRIIKTKGLDRRGVAFTWDPKLGRKVHIPWANGMMCTLPTFHTWSFQGFFKPTLAETLGCIRAWVPDWKHARFFYQKMNTDGHDSIIGSYHIGRCFLYGPEYQNVLDELAAEASEP